MPSHTKGNKGEEEMVHGKMGRWNDSMTKACPSTDEKKPGGVTEKVLPMRLSASWLILCFLQVHGFASHWFSVEDYYLLN